VIICNRAVKIKIKENTGHKNTGKYRTATKIQESTGFTGPEYCSNNDFVFQQDRAPAHRSHHTVA